MTRHAHLGLVPALKWRLFQLSAAGVRTLPQASEGGSALAGDIAWLLAGKRRRAVTANLRFLDPLSAPARLRARSRAVFRSAARYYVELLRLPYTNLAAFHALIDVEGYEHFLEAQARGKGVIVASMHYGPAEILLQAFTARGVHYTAMVEQIRPAGLARLFLCLREAHGNQYVFPDLAGTKRLLRTLHARGVAAVLVDRDVLGSGIEATFCSGTIHAPAGAVELARLTGAAIVPAIGRWRPGGRYSVDFMPPVTLEGDRRDRRALRRNVERVLAGMEPFLRRDPGQWLVLEQLWRDPPPRSVAAYTEAHHDETAGAGEAVGDG